MRRIAIGIFLCLLAPGLATGQANKQTADIESRPPTAELYGGIEISPRVVRLIALRISDRGDGPSLKVIHSTSLPIPAGTIAKEGKLTSDYIRAAAQTVLGAFRQLQQQHRVPESQIHILGLSDFSAANLDEFRDEIADKTGRPAAFVNAETETELSIAGIIPRRYRVGNKTFDNRGISMLLDVGSTSLRGGYQQIKPRTQGQPEFEFVTWSIPKGAASFAADVTAAAGESADLATYARRTQNVGAAIRPLLQAQTSAKPALLNRKKIYLTGGIVWTMMVLLHPEDQSNFTTITSEDINTFYNRALLDAESLMNPDLSKIPDEASRNEMRRARDSIKQTYSPKSLIAGAELLRLLATELQFQNRTIIYPRYAWLARILSYVRLQPE
jgi:hypothetical protein